MKEIFNIKHNLLKFLVCSIMIAGLTGCNTSVAEVKHEAKNVKVIKASKSTIEINVEYPGKLKPVEEINVSSKLAGKVSSINADVGQEVSKGQVLFTLDTVDIDAQYKQSLAGLEAAKASYVRTSDSSLEQQITQAEAAVKQAQVQYVDASNYNARVKSLYKENAASKQQIDDAESKLSLASIQLENAQRNLSLLKQKAGPQSIQAAAAQVKQAQAAADVVSTQLQNAVVEAPISGVVSIRNVDVGEMTSGAPPAFTIINTRTMFVEVSVTDTMAQKLTKNQKIIIRVSPLESKVVEGLIENISPVPDSRTQFYIVKIKLDNKEDIFRPGMFARVIFPMEKKDNVLAVPNDSIVVENGIQYIYISEEGVVKKRVVSIGVSNEKLTEVTANLKEGDNVIFEGQNFLNEGEKVNIINN